MTPRTSTDRLLADLLDEVRGLRADLLGGTQPSPTTIAGDLVTLTEPARPDDPVDVERFHTGRGWYQPPGATRKMRRHDAVAFLQEG